MAKNIGKRAKPGRPTREEEERIFQERKAEMKARLTKRNMQEKLKRKQTAAHHIQEHNMSKMTMSEQIDANIKSLLQQLVKDCRKGSILPVDWTDKESRSILSAQQTNIKNLIEIINKLKDLKEKLRDEILKDNEKSKRKGATLALIEDARMSLAEAGYDPDKLLQTQKK